MATIIKDGVVIQVNLKSVKDSMKQFPDCLVISDKGICGQLWDGEKLSNPLPVVDDSQDAKNEIAASDRRMARFAEDIFDVLKAKGVIKNSDFSAQTVKLMSDRKAMRSRIK